MFKKFLSKPLISLILLFFIALFVRGVLVNWTLPYGNNLDFSRYEDWTRVAHVYGFGETYKTNHLLISKYYPNNQPPGSLFILSGAYESWIITGKVISRLAHISPRSNNFINTYLQHIFMKMPGIISDLVMGFLVFLVVSKYAGRKRGFMAASLILFNPVVLYNSSVWGQSDSWNNLFLMLSLFFATRKNVIASIISFAISIYIKFSLLPLVPFYFVFLFFISGRNIKRILAGVVLSIALILLATLLVSPNPLTWILAEFPVIARGELQNMTIASFNFWWMVLCFPNVGHAHIPLITDIFMGLSLGTWGYIFFGTLTLPLIYFQLKMQEKMPLKTVFLIFSIVALLAFLFLPGMHDRYMYPVFPLLAVSVSLLKNMKVYITFLLLFTLFNLINVIYSWYPIPLSSNTDFYHIFYGDYFGWIVSIATVLVSVLFYVFSLNKVKKGTF